MMLFIPRINWAILNLGLCFILTCSLKAQDADTTFLLKPENALLATPSSSNEITLAPQVDGAELPFTTPQILIYRNTDQAEFVSAVWRDAAGQLSHQRNVFVVKPDYEVIVDYVYGKAQHAIVRHFGLSSDYVLSDAKGAQAGLSGGKMLRVQAIDTANAALTTQTPGKVVAFSSSVTTPTPLATVLTVWAGTTAPRIEFVKPANPMIVKFKVTFADGRIDDVGVAWELRPLHLKGVELKGWAACARQGPTGASSIEIK